MNRKTWKEFSDTGLMWWMNMILQTFGWSIVIATDDEDLIEDVFPARVEFRGYDEPVNDKGYWKVAHYLLENGEKLEEEAFHNELINKTE